MEKPAPVDHEVHELIRKRWSPRAFAERAIDEGVMRSLLEAVRWAPSCANEQPWRLIVARRGDSEAFARLLSCLNESNQRWAKDAAALMITAARMHFKRDGKDNRHAFYDVGQGLAQFSLQATALGVVVHQMAGFDVGRARHILSIPEDCEPVTAVAFGYPGQPESLADDLRQRELAERMRIPQDEFVFSGSWGKPL